MNSIYFVYYGVVINVIGLLIMWIDKSKAQSEKWRIPEKTLWLVTLLGGCLGTFFGMTWFRHKTKNWQFIWGIPLVILLELAIVVKLLI